MTGIETDDQARTRWLRELLDAIERLQEPLDDAVAKKPSVAATFEQRIVSERACDRLFVAVAGVLGRADAIRTFRGARV